MRSSEGIPLEATLLAIDWQLKLFPPVVTPDGSNLRVDCEADIVYQLAKRPGVPVDVQRTVVVQYLTWRLTATQQVQSGSQVTHPDLSYWKRRLGLNLAYIPEAYPTLIPSDLVERIALIKPAHLLIDGLMGLKALSFNEEMAEKKPELVLRVLRFGYDREKLDHALVNRVMTHLLVLAENNLPWRKRWPEVKKTNHITTNKT